MQDANGNIVMKNADTPKTITEHKGFAMQPVFNIEQLELWTDKEGNKYLNSEFKHNELVDFINNNYQIIESKKVKTKAKSKVKAKPKAKEASVNKDVKTDVKTDTKASELNTDKIEVINVTSISELEQKQSEDINTNNSLTKDFKEIVLTDELKTVIRAALKFVAKTDYRECLKTVHIMNLNDKLTVLSSDAHAIFRFETDIDLPESECGFVSAGIMHDKDFKTKLENAVSIKDLELTYDNFGKNMHQYFSLQEIDKQELKTNINLNAFYMETISKTCKELCRKRIPAFNIEIHQTYIMCTLHLSDKFKGNCSIVLFKMIV